MNFSFSETSINRQIINLSFQTGFIQIYFFQLALIIGKFLINSCCIGLYANTLFNLFCKILIAYQFLNSFNYKWLNICFSQRCLIITMMSSFLLISAANIIVNLFVCAIFICPSVFVRIH